MSRSSKWQSADKRAAKRFACASYVLNRKARKDAKIKRKKNNNDKSRDLE